MASTPLRALRVSDELWRSAQARAAAVGETVSEVVRRSLAEYVARGELEDAALRRPSAPAAGAEPPAGAVVPLAQGMIMYRLGYDVDAAAAHLRELAARWEVDLEEAARSVVAVPVSPGSLDQP